MPNHSDAEKARIRDIVKPYLPTNYEQKGARRDCPFHSLHHHQASYGQKNFANIGLIYEFCRAQTTCQFHGRPLVLQMSAAKRADLLSKLETLDPPPYHDPANVDICRWIRDEIFRTNDVTTGTADESPTTPTRGRLSHLGLQSLARSGSLSELGSSSLSASSSSKRSISSPPGVPHASPSQTSLLLSAETKDTKGPGRPKKAEFEVTVFAYLRNKEPVTTVKAVGYLTGRKQVEFKFWQKAIAEAFGFDLAKNSRPKFHLYLPHGDEWTDRILPRVLVRGEPVLVRRENVRAMPSLELLKPLLNPPFNRDGVRPLSTLFDYVLGFPSGPAGSASDPGPVRTGVRPDASSTFANIFGGPPDRHANTVRSSPSPSQRVSNIENETPPSSSSRTLGNVGAVPAIAAAGASHKRKRASGAAGSSRPRQPTPDDAIILSENEENPPKKGKAKAAVNVSVDDIIDLTL